MYIQYLIKNLVKIVAFAGKLQALAREIQAEEVMKLQCLCVRRGTQHFPSSSSSAFFWLLQNSSGSSFS